MFIEESAQMVFRQRPQKKSIFHKIEYDDGEPKLYLMTLRSVQVRPGHYALISRSEVAPTSKHVSLEPNAVAKPVSEYAALVASAEASLAASCATSMSNLLPPSSSTSSLTSGSSDTACTLQQEGIHLPAMATMALSGPSADGGGRGGGAGALCHSPTACLQPAAPDTPTTAITMMPRVRLMPPPPSPRLALTPALRVPQAASTQEVLAKASGTPTKQMEAMFAPRSMFAQHLVEQNKAEEERAASDPTLRWQHQARAQARAQAVQQQQQLQVQEQHAATAAAAATGSQNVTVFELPSFYKQPTLQPHARMEEVLALDGEPQPKEHISAHEHAHKHKHTLNYQYPPQQEEEQQEEEAGGAQAKTLDELSEVFMAEQKRLECLDAAWAEGMPLEEQYEDAAHVELTEDLAEW